MTRRASRWQFAPRPGLATLAVFGGWAAAAVPLLLITAILLLSGPWDPSDLTDRDWRYQAERYRDDQMVALGLLTPLALLGIVAAVGGMLRRWAAPVVFAIALLLPVGGLALYATAGMEERIAIALERATQPDPPAPSSPPPSPTPDPAPTFTEAEVVGAVQEAVAFTLAAAEQPALSADGVRLEGSEAVPIGRMTCDVGGVAASAAFSFTTPDNIESEEAVLRAWVAAGYLRDRAAGTNLIYGDEQDPLLRLSLRGTADGMLKLFIESRCASG